MTIKTKITLLPFIIIALSLFISGTISFIYFEKLFFENIKINTERGFDIAKNIILDEENRLKDKTSLFLTQNKIINNFLNDEKLDIGFYLSSFLKTFDGIAIYDLNHKLKSFAVIKNDKTYIGRVNLKDEIEFLFHKIDDKVIRDSLKSRKMELSIKDFDLYLDNYAPIIEDDKIKGYLLVSKRIGQKIVQNIVVDIGGLFWLSGENLIDTEHFELFKNDKTIPNLYDKVDVSKVNLIDDGEFILNVKYLILDKKILLISGIEKNNLYKNREDIIKVLLIIFIVSIIFLFPFSIFLIKRDIEKPINKILENISLQKNEIFEMAQITQQDLNSKSHDADEIKQLEIAFMELSDIAKRNILELKNINSNLNITIEEKLEKIRRKDELIFEQIRKESIANLLINLAHQWRQPLNVVAIYLQNIEDILEEDDFKDKVSEVVNTSLGEISLLSSILSTFTKFYETKSILTQVKIISCYNKTVELIGNDLKLNSIKINHNIPVDLEIFVYESDIVEFLIEIFLNVKQIVQARDLKGATIYVVAFSENNKIYIEVSDDCGGIEERMIDTIFEAYATTAFKSRNKGLGLYMVKKILKDRYDANITAKNNQNGATFIMEFLHG